MKKIIVVGLLALSSSVYTQDGEVAQNQTEAMADVMPPLVDSSDNAKELFFEEEEEQDSYTMPTGTETIKKTYPGILGYAQVALRYLYTSISGLI